MLPQILQHYPGRFRLRPQPCRRCQDAFTWSLTHLCRRCFLRYCIREQVRDIRRALRRGDDDAAFAHTVCLAAMLRLPQGGTGFPTGAELRRAALAALGRDEP